MTGRVFSINISDKKGGPKQMVARAVLEKDRGLAGDAHAGPGDRQVSLLAVEDVEKAESRKRSGIDLAPGIFAENITTQGLDLSRLKLGDRLLVGEDVVLRVSRIGKDCPRPCSVGRALGECLMPKQGLFAAVEAGGDIKVHDRIRVKERRPSVWRKIPFFR